MGGLLVRRQLSIAGMEIAERGDGLRIAGKRCAAQPRLAVRGIFRNAHSAHERQSPLQLSSAVSSFGSTPIIRGGLGPVARDSKPVLARHAEQVERRRKLGLRGPAQMRDHLVLQCLVAAPMRQCDRVAEISLRTPGGRRTRVPAAGLIRVAHVFGAGREHEPQQGLGLGASMLGGAARPPNRRNMVRLRLVRRPEQVGSAD